MAAYSQIPAVDEAFRRWVREEDAPQPLWPPALEKEPLAASIRALDPDLKVAVSVDATVELSALALGVKATKLVAEPLLYAQLDVHLARTGRVALLAWQWRRDAKELFPSRGAEPPGATDRSRALATKVGDLLAAGGATLVSWEEAARVVAVTDDPRYEGAGYDITIFEALFGMGYPERQR